MCVMKCHNNQYRIVVRKQIKKEEDTKLVVSALNEEEEKVKEESTIYLFLKNLRLKLLIYSILQKYNW